MKEIKDDINRWRDIPCSWVLYYKIILYFQYYKNDYTTKYNLQIECNHYQITNGIFHRTRTKNFTIHIETQKTQTVKAVSRMELEEASFLTSDYTTKLQSSRQYGTGTKNGNPLQYSCLENPMDGGAW